MRVDGAASFSFRVVYVQPLTQEPIPPSGLALVGPAEWALPELDDAPPADDRPELADGCCVDVGVWDDVVGGDATWTGWLCVADVACVVRA